MSRLIISGHPNELKQLDEVTPKGTRRVQAEGREGVASLMTSARTLPYIRSATIFGTALHLLVDSNVSNDKIKHDLESFGITEVTVTEIAPTLEDVFVQLTETRGKEIDAQRAAMTGAKA
jgi:hypothetical protein